MNNIEKSNKKTANSEDDVVKESIFVVAYSYFQLVTWGIVFLLLINQVFNILSFELFEYLFIILKLAQTAQLVEVLFACFGLTRSNKLASFIQVTARIINTYLLYNFNTPLLTTAITLFPWSITEIIRSLFYLNKDSTLFSVLRYNAFIVLYPLGVFGEILGLENLLISQSEFKIYIRVAQIVLVLGFVMLYNYMLVQRAKYYKKVNEKKIN